MYLHSDSQSEDSSSEDFAPQDSRFNNKYILESKDKQFSSKYQSPKADAYPSRKNHKVETESFGIHTSSEFKLGGIGLHGAGGIQADTLHRTSQLESQAQHLKLLLQKEIEKSRQLQGRLFMRQKELMSIRSREKPAKRSPPARVWSPNVASSKSQHLRDIQQELDKLKEQIVRSNAHKDKMEILRLENVKLRKANKKSADFVSAISMSIGIITKDIPPKGVTKTWKAWRNLFNQIAKQNQMERI